MKSVTLHIYDCFLRLVEGNWYCFFSVIDVTSLFAWCLSGLKHEIDSLSLSSSIPINNNSTATSIKAETPNVKKKQHRRMKSNSKSIDANSLDGGRE